MIDLRQSGDGAFTSATARALLDGDCWWNTVNRIHIGTRRRLYELARIGVHGFEIAPLALIKENIERERRFPRARDACNDRESIARDLDIDALEVVLAGIVNDHRVPVVSVATTILRSWFSNCGGSARSTTHTDLARDALFVCGESLSGEGSRVRA